jgi:hypothetical protein
VAVAVEVGGGDAGATRPTTAGLLRCGGLGPSLLPYFAFNSAKL